MDTGDLFAYPTEPAADAPPPGAFLDDADEQEWETLLGYMQTQSVYAGETLFNEGDVDRALYLVAIGEVELVRADGVAVALSAPVPLNEIAFVDGGGCAATARALADCELLRLSYDAFEALAARESVLARKLLLDLGRMLARALRSEG